MTPENLVSLAKDWALTHGLCYVSSTDANQHIHAPFALFPTVYPKEEFQKVLELQPIFNSLVHRAASDESFIHDVMGSLQGDAFMMKLYDIFKSTRGCKSKNDIVLGIHRSDYLLDEQDSVKRFLQVELNTISSSFSSLATIVSNLHQFLIKYENEQIQGTLPTNTSLHDVPAALAEAWKAYQSPKSVIVMVVQPGERNLFDQRFIELQLFEKHGIYLLRKTLKEMNDMSHLKDDGTLWIDGKEVAIVYYRAGYTPNDYHSQDEWNARLKIEKSLAVKCPNIEYHIIGAKKVQQVLTDENILSRFIQNEVDRKKIMSSFAGLYPLDQSVQGLQAFEMAMKSPELYVLKPQREGGGNNIYGNDIPAFLSKLSISERNAYILMELIKTKPLDGSYMVKNGSLSQQSVISELGIYGVWLSIGQDTMLNKNAGYLVRTKAVGINEGGVAAGYSVLDSPILT